MKRFIPLNVCIAIVLCLATPSNALFLGSGESVTFSIDFSSDTVLPPYDGYHLYLLVDSFVDPITSSGKMSFYGMDSNGPWQYPSPADGEIGGLIWSVYDEIDVKIDIGTVGFEDENFTNDTIQFIKVCMELGSANIDQIKLSMIVRGESGGDSLSTSAIDGVPMTPVPEPSTILLTGFGLVALAGIRKKLSG